MVVKMGAGTLGARKRKRPPAICRAASTRCAAKKRSATIPTKNGDTMAAMEVAL